MDLCAFLRCCDTTARPFGAPRKSVTHSTVFSATPCSSDDVGQGEEALPRNGREGQGALRPGDAELRAAQGSGDWPRQEEEADQGPERTEAIAVSWICVHFVAVRKIHSWKTV